MAVEKTLRLHDAGKSHRYVRVVGDGTPEGTRVLNYDGSLLEGKFLGAQIHLSRTACASGTIFLAIGDPPVEASFFGYVLFEPLDGTKPNQGEAAQLLSDLDEVREALRDIRCAARDAQHVVGAIQARLAELTGAVGDEEEDDGEHIVVSAERRVQGEVIPTNSCAIPGPSIEDLQAAIVKDFKGGQGREGE